MPEQLLGPDGQPLDVEGAEQAFAQAMAAPVDGDEVPEYPAPPRKDPAPFGVKADGSPRQRKPGPGRGNRAEDKPRTARSVPKTPAKGKPAAESDRDYTDTLTGFGSAVWMGLASVPVKHSQAFAAVWQAQLPAQVAAWNKAAQQDATVRRMVEKLEGGPTWVIGVAIATAPLVGGALAIVRDPQARDQLAARTGEEFAGFLEAYQPAEAEAEPAAA